MKNKPYRFLLYLGLRGSEGLALCLPRPVLLGLARRVGRIAFWLAPREREKTIQHLKGVYGEAMDASEIQALAKRIFIHLAETAADVLRLPVLRLKEAEGLVEPGDAIDRINALREEGRGIILITAHLGNWELLGAYLRLLGYEGAAVGRRTYYEKFNKVLIRLRQSAGLQTVFQHETPRELFRLLRQNQMIGLLVDQDIDHLQGIYVPFLGRPAYTMTAPVKLALATGAPLVPMFLVREGDRYRLLLEEPIRVEFKGTREETIFEYTVCWSRVIEEKIRQYPDQWAWMHRRWKTSQEALTV